MNSDRTWLGEDLSSWTASMLSGLTRSHLLFALAEAGVFAAIDEAGDDGRTSDELAAECALDRRLLEGALTFLALADQVLVKKGDRFFSGERAEWLGEDQTRGVSLLYVGGYSCLLSNLLPALRKEERYGVDFERPGDMVARGSYIATRANYPWILSELSALGVEVVADLGCGAAHILIDFCGRRAELQGVGIDISPEALTEARRAVEDAGLTDRIRLIEGDITRPRDYAAQLGDVQAFNANFVLHEFLRDGEQAVVEILRQMKELFPGRYLVVAEFDAPSDEEYLELPIPDRIFMLFYQHIIHPMSWQGLPIPTASWRRLYQRAGIELLKVKDDHPRRLHVHLARF